MLGNPVDDQEDDTDYDDEGDYPMPVFEDFNVSDKKIAEEMSEEQIQEIIDKSMDAMKKDKEKSYGALNNPIWPPVAHLPLPESAPPSDHAVLLEQITLLRDLLIGKNNWLDVLLKEERARNEKLLAENAVLRKDAERLRIGLAQALSSDDGLDNEEFDRVWKLTQV